MSDGYVQVAPDSTGKRIDNSPIVLPAGTVIVNSDGTKTTLAVDTIVYRQRTVIADPSNPTAMAAVLLNNPAAGEYGLVVLPSGDDMNTTHELLYLILQELKQLNAGG
jgi:hypothetical protein